MDTAHDADRRVEQARESLLARVEELTRRIHEAREKLDIKAHIAAHPRAAVGIAFAAGLLLGIPGGKRAKSAMPDAKQAKAGALGAVMAMAGSVVFSVLKSVALHHLSGTAKTWWDQRMESETSHTRDVESFLEH